MDVGGLVGVFPEGVPRPLLQVLPSLVALVVLMLRMLLRRGGSLVGVAPVALRVRRVAARAPAAALASVPPRHRDPDVDGLVVWEEASPWLPPRVPTPGTTTVTVCSSCGFLHRPGRLKEWTRGSVPAF